MLDPEFKIGGWRPFLELHSIEKLLKRIVYGRRYSKPSDHFFQDNRWQAWQRTRERTPPKRHKPSTSPPHSFVKAMKAGSFIERFGTPPEMVRIVRDSAPLKDIVNADIILNNATDKQREGAYAFYLSETMAHKAKPRLLINTDNKGGEKWVQLPRDPGWDNPAPSKEVRR